MALIILSHIFPVNIFCIGNPDGFCIISGTVYPVKFRRIPTN